MNPVVIYTTRICPYCISAKHLLSSKRVAYEEIPVDGDPAIREKMTQRANGRRTVPQIFIGDHHVGGRDELFMLEQSGELDALLSSNNAGVAIGNKQ